MYVENTNDIIIFSGLLVNSFLDLFINCSCNCCRRSWRRGFINTILHIIDDNDGVHVIYLEKDPVGLTFN